LTLAIHGGDLDALRRIVADRPELASVRMIGRKGLEGGWRTPLHAATDWPGYFPAAPAVVATLLEAGADPNDGTGGDRPETPLHWAASTDDVDVAVVLIDNGADLETPGGSIGTPLDNAIGYGCWHACAGGQRRAAEYLLARGADLNWIPEYAEGTPLDSATSLGTRQENVVSWLRERGATSAKPRD
jgi:hypothetical protein